MAQKLFNGDLHNNLNNSNNVVLLYFVIKYLDLTVFSNTNNNNSLFINTD